MCGIFGQITSNPKKLNLRNIAILGIMNEVRGTTSCGLSFDGEIYTGTGTESKFRDFIPNIITEIPQHNYILGHTRAASTGMAVSVYNVHPFGFGENPETRGLEFIGAHNGTLFNYEDLAKEYGIELTAELKGDQIVTKRTKIDSEILLEIIYKNRDFSVLAKYNGGAALAMIDTVKNKAYLYSGASSKSAYTIKVEEERPLHVFEESVDNIYISSEMPPLAAIAGFENIEKINQIESNTVYEFTPGDFTNAVKHKIDRSEMTQTKVYHTASRLPAQASQTRVDYGYGARSQDYYDNFDEYDNQFYGRNNRTNDQEGTKKVEETGTNSLVGKKRFSLSHVAAQTDTFWVFNHVDSKFKCKSIVIPGTSVTTSMPFTNSDWHEIPYENNLRYKTNFSTYFKNLNGIYFYVEGYGYYFAGKTSVEVAGKIKEVENKYLDYRNGNLVDEKTGEKLGILATNMKKHTYAEHFFYEGYKLKASLDYMQVTTHPGIVSRTGATLNICGVKMSHMTTYPVFDIITNKYYKDGRLYTGGVMDYRIPFNYSFVEGVITKVDCRLGNQRIAYSAALRQVDFLDELKKDYILLRNNVINLSQASLIIKPAETPMIEIDAVETVEKDVEKDTLFNEILINVLSAYEHFVYSEDSVNHNVLNFYMTVDNEFLDPKKYSLDDFLTDLKIYTELVTADSKTPLSDLTLYATLYKLLKDYK